jgi:hypothetical protein
MGFLTNDSDRKIMLGQQDKMAQAMTEGIMDYLGWYGRKKSLSQYARNSRLGLHHKGKGVG